MTSFSDPNLTGAQAPGEPLPATDEAASPKWSKFSRDVTADTLQQVLTESSVHPVLLLVWSPRSLDSVTLANDLADLADEADGRVLIARVNADAEPEVVQALGATGVPIAVLIIGGQAQPLFQGAAGREQLEPLFQQITQAGVAYGAVGKAKPNQPPADPESDPEDYDRHPEAFALLEEGEFSAAEQAFAAALAEDSSDDVARLGLAQAKLLQRIGGVDFSQALAEANESAAASDVAKQFVAADVEMMSDEVQAAFGRLLDLVRVTFDDEREEVRVRLLELFELLDAGDERVLKARRALGAALY